MLVLKDEKGDDVQVGELAEECGVVLFLVPKADTRTRLFFFSPRFVDERLIVVGIVLAAGCTTQACGYRDVYPEFTEREYVVYCLSADSPTAQSKWQKKVFWPFLWGFLRGVNFSWLFHRRSYLIRLYRTLRGC